MTLFGASAGTPRDSLGDSPGDSFLTFWPGARGIPRRNHKKVHLNVSPERIGLVGIFLSFSLRKFAGIFCCECRTEVGARALATATNHISHFRARAIDLVSSQVGEVAAHLCVSLCDVCQKFTPWAAPISAHMLDR